jgi:hypothetical protein
VSAPAPPDPGPDPEADGEPGAASDPEPAGVSHRLDPDLAVDVTVTDTFRPPPRVIDTKPYRWAVGVFGLVLLLAISVYQFATNGIGTAGVPARQRLYLFAAPVATSSLRGDANFTRPCALGRFGSEAVNTCLLVRRTPLVLGFFVTGSDDCKHEIDTLDAVSHQFSPGDVQFAAVGVRAAQSDVARLVRSHHWTIPVAYDRDGAVGELYGVSICPLVELAYRGGVVKDRLIGNHWLSATALAAQVHALVGR